MSSLMKHKRVEFTELFYDLVFVYAISKTTALIHHLHHGVVSVDAMLAFLMGLVVLVNNWMIQTVYTNRYGRNSMVNILVMFTNMALLLLVSNMIVNEWQGYFSYFCLIIGLLTLTLFVQYLIEYFRESSTAEDHRIMKGFLVMTGLRTLTSLVASVLPMPVGQPIFIVGIVVTFLMPLSLGKDGVTYSVNVPHLIERISLLVIITFGEMIMGIAAFFTPETLSFNSVLFFLMMTSLFMYYFGQFDHAIDEEHDKKGLFLIYTHYPIFIGLIMTTVSMNFLLEEEANHLFVVLFLYTGLLLFQWAVLANGKHNKSYLRYSTRYILTELGLDIVSIGLSLIFAENNQVVLIITTVFLFAIEAHFTHFYITQTMKHGKANWFWA